MSQGRTLWLFTMRFPYGTGEPFLENELPVLCERFAEVIIVPLFVEGEARTIPENARILKVLDDPYRSASLLSVFRHLRTYLSLMRGLRSEAPTREAFRQRKSALRSQVRQAVQRATELEQTLMPGFDPERTVLYSYWMADWAVVLGILRARHPALRFVARVHGFDLFPERSADGWIPFRTFHLQHVDKVYCVSQAGLDRMRQLHPAQADRFSLARLGTVDHGLAPWSPDPVLRIISVSNLVPLKRVALLADALRHVNIAVHWTHVGDGPERAETERRIAGLPAHVQAVLLGNVPNQQLLRSYADVPKDLFVHVSASEGGVPVSIQEAASFGIPALACDAGGVREIVGEGGGILLPTDVDAVALARAVELAATQLTTVPERQRVRRTWEQGFRAPVNFGHFCDSLLQRER